MNTVRIYRLTHLSPTLFKRLRAAQMEAAQIWNYCCAIHKQARATYSPRVAQRACKKDGWRSRGLTSSLFLVYYGLNESVIERREG